jgi:peptidoglycan/LPS O-acetylase OafA/YrhL
VVPQIEIGRVGAVAAIFLFHLWSAVPDGAGSGWLSAALQQGHLGVVVFDIITGLVLAWPHLGPAGRPLPAWGTFLRRRFVRIVPAYYLALGLWVAVAAAVAAAGLGEAPRLRSVVTHLLFVHTLSAADFFAIVPAYWWLGLLAQLYLAFPLVLRLQRATGPWRGLAAICVATLGGWLAVDALARAWPASIVPLINYLGYYNLPYRLPEFARGVALARALRGGDTGAARLPGRSAAALLAGCAGIVAVTAGLPPLAPLVHLRLVAICAALFVCLLALPVAERAGRSGWIARVAAASYGIYLLHQPLLGYGASMLAAVLAAPVRFGVLLVAAGWLALRAAIVLDRLAARIGRAV